MRERPFSTTPTLDYAAGDATPGKRRAIRRQRRHRDIAKRHGDIGKHFRLQYFDGAANLRLPELIDATLKLESRARARQR